MFSLSKMATIANLSIYHVELDKPYTLKEFIDAILVKEKDKHVFLRVIDTDRIWYEQPYIECRLGDVIRKSHNFPEDRYDCKLLIVSASETTHNIEYQITLEKKED